MTMAEAEFDGKRRLTAHRYRPPELPQRAPNPELRGAGAQLEERVAAVIVPSRGNLARFQTRDRNGSAQRSVPRRVRRTVPVRRLGGRRDVPTEIAALERPDKHARQTWS
jgi:hypothetical protein